MLYSKLIGKLLELLKQDLSLAEDSLNATKSYQQSDDLKQEGKYDTRSIEAGYLKLAQELRVKELEGQIQLLENINIEQSHKIIQLGSIAEVLTQAGLVRYFVLPAGAGKKINFNDQIYQVITPNSELGESLIGLKVGDEFEIEINNQIKEYEIKKILS